MLVCNEHKTKHVVSAEGVPNKPELSVNARTMRRETLSGSVWMSHESGYECEVSETPKYVEYLNSVEQFSGWRVCVRVCACRALRATLHNTSGKTETAYENINTQQ